MFKIIAIAIVIVYFILRLWGKFNNPNHKRRYLEQKAMRINIYEFLR